MSDKSTLKPLVAALGTTFAISLTAAPAAENPFAINKLGGGYMVADSHEGKCGEAKCGADKKEAEGKCGEKKENAEGKCGEAKCGADKKEAEGKCGEAN